MAAKIKLQRVGAKNDPKYRLIVQEERTKLEGKVVEILGEYDPTGETPVMNFKKELIEKWLKVGARPTDKVRFLLGKAGILPPVDTSALVKKKPKKEVKTEEAKAPEAKAPEAPAAEEKTEEKAPEAPEQPAEEAKG